MSVKCQKSLLLIGFISFLVSCSATQSTVPISSNAPAVSPSPTAKVITVPLLKETESKTILTLEKIMSDPDWMGRQPQSPYWSDDSLGIFYQQKRQGSPVKDTFYRGLTSKGNGEKITYKDMHLHGDQTRVFNQNKTMSAWIFKGSLFVRDLVSNRVKQLTRDSSGAHTLVFLKDGRLSYQVSNAIYAIHPTTGFNEQLVSWQFAKEPKALKAPADYIAEQQQSLIETIDKKRRHKKLTFQENELLARKNDAIAAPSFYFSPGNELVEASISPNGKFLIIVDKEQTKRRDSHDIMPSYINDDGRIAVNEVRRRVIDEEPQSQTVWLIDIELRKKNKLSYNTLPGYNEDVLASVKQENAKAKGKEYRPNRLPRHIGLMLDWYWSQSPIQWHRNGNDVAIMLEAWDNKDRWLVNVDIQNAKLVNQHRLHDNAWINYKFNSFGWLNHSRSLYYLSEETGYSQLYLKPLSGKAVSLTTGEFEVDQLTLTADDKSIFFKGNIKHPGIYEIYKVALKDSEIQAVTDLNGMTDYRLSPSEKHVLLTHSSLTRPPELYFQEVDNKKVMQLTHTTSEEFKSINWLAPDIVPVKSSNTIKPIFSRVYTPRNMLPGEKYKAVVFNHGAGYLQNSHLGWSGYFREFMFHNLLTQKGYVVLDMDYRASAGYGRDWRTAIYRQMGTPEVEDLKDGVNWLVDNVNVDAKRVGTYGGSYGGFLTFMSLFNAPDLFQAGAALRPVTDWAHYNHGYTSNILNTPQVDPIAYERSSPIYFAEGLEKPLLINAPMIDNNVFFVDTVRLVQRLIELEKEDFETAIYPVESHGFVQPSSWLDEYRRILKLFENNL